MVWVGVLCATAVDCLLPPASTPGEAMAPRRPPRPSTTRPHPLSNRNLGSDWRITERDEHPAVHALTPAPHPPPTPPQALYGAYGGSRVFAIGVHGDQQRTGHARDLADDAHEIVGRRAQRRWGCGRRRNTRAMRTHLDQPIPSAQRTR
jgi:hypothetical protein